MPAIDLYFDSDDPRERDRQRLTRCKDTQPGTGKRCNMERKHYGPHMIKIDQRTYEIWPEPEGPVDFPEWF